MIKYYALVDFRSVIVSVELRFPAAGTSSDTWRKEFRVTLVLADIALGSPVLLAPMAGITDLPFRRVVAGFGAGLVVSEMVACGEVVTARPSVRAKARTDLGIGDGLTSVQLAGREAAPMAEAARIVTAMGAQVIDINMGCPAKQVTGGYSGSALMRDPDHALRLIEAVVRATHVPVTLKCRLGWDTGCLNAPDLARRAEGAGIRMVTIHGRTRQQFYKDQADWAAIRRVVDAVRIPVVANGDVTDAASARAALAASGAAGVMIGRGAQGAPWKIAGIAAALYGTPAPVVPSGSALADLVQSHHQAILSFYGHDLGIRVARKHLGWYCDAAGADRSIRAALMVATDAVAVQRLIARALTDLPAQVAA
jgi:tRNA-dihydrouridine synthase B